MVEKKIEEKNLVTMDNIEKMYPWADYIDKAMIQVILNSQKSMSVYVFKRKFEESIKFWERLDNICKQVKGIARWEEEKPTLQIGKSELKVKKEEASKTGSSSYSKVQFPQEMKVNNNDKQENNEGYISNGKEVN